MKSLRHYFIPHPHTHQKAHLLSWHYLLIYLLLFVLLRVGLDMITIYRPGVLGVTSSNINVQRLIEETNRERQQKGLPLLKENSALSAAAAAKAANMFEENYWAHFSPSGKDPWGFIKSAGYRFAYAGENLARNFTNPDDIVRAWMNSPSHRDNILNSRYNEIGIAAVDGVLQGQQTTLVVQMFGTPYNAPQTASNPAPKPQVKAEGKSISLELSQIEKESPVAPVVETRPAIVAGSNVQNSKAVIDSEIITKVFSIGLIAFISLLLVLDFIVLKRRGVFRVSSHHLAHLSFLAVSSAAVLSSHSGEILEGLSFYIR